MCLPWWRTHPASPPPPPPSPPPPPPPPSPLPLPRFPITPPADQPSSLSRSAASSTNECSKESLSSTSSSSLPGIKDLLPDGPILYRRAEIEAATLFFGASHQIGASVWKAVLKGTSVAVVRKPGSVEGFKKVLRNACSMHHSSLAKLLGGCTDGEYVYLVYDFVKGDDLGSCLRSNHVPGYTVLSTWRARMQVALDVAKGLEYLHQHALSSFVHKHLTSRNILIVSDTLRAKIAFVGLAALTGEAKLQSPERSTDEESNEEVMVDRPQKQRSIRRSRSVKITGTHGYMAPEYLSHGVLTPKYDVFSFGVVLLELLSGQQAVTVRYDEQTNTTKKYSLVEEVGLLLNSVGSKGKLRLWIDRRINDSYPVEDALKVAQLANSCLNADPEKRPQMSEVAVKLTKIFDSARRWEKERDVSTHTTTLQAR